MEDILKDKVKKRFADSSDETIEGLPFAVGENWNQRVLEFDCRSTESSVQDITLSHIVNKITRTTMFPTLVDVDMSVYWTYKSEEVRSVRLNAMYNLATRTLIIPSWMYRGIMLETTYKYLSGEKVYLGQNIVKNIKAKCASWYGSPVDPVSLDNFLD